MSEPKEKEVATCIRCKKEVKEVKGFYDPADGVTSNYCIDNGCWETIRRLAEMEWHSNDHLEEHQVFVEM